MFVRYCKTLDAEILTGEENLELDMPAFAE